MQTANHFLFFLGGITVFLLGLMRIGESAESLTGERSRRILLKCSSNALRGVTTGSLVTAIAQSSVAVTYATVSLVESGVLTFYSASAIVMGANIGTTVTAQIVSLSGATSFDITAFGSLALFTGFALRYLLKKRNNRTIGGFLIGFGLIFVGLEIMSGSVEYFKSFEWFTNIFLIDNPLVLLLNGFAVTAVMQSSSAVTGIMVLLAESGLLTFENAIFIILGSNVGTCVPVILSSMAKGETARRTAFFNLFFNLFGVSLFFLPTCLFGKGLSALFLGGGSIGRGIANFHTAFNLIVTLITLPLLKPFTALAGKIVAGDCKKHKNLTKKQTFGVL